MKLVLDVAFRTCFLWLALLDSTGLLDNGAAPPPPAEDAPLPVGFVQPLVAPSPHKFTLVAVETRTLNVRDAHHDRRNGLRVLIDVDPPILPRETADCQISPTLLTSNDYNIGWASLPFNEFGRHTPVAWGYVANRGNGAQIMLTPREQPVYGLEIMLYRSDETDGGPGNPRHDFGKPICLESLRINQHYLIDNRQPPTPAKE